MCALLLVVSGRLVQLQGLDAGHYAQAASAERLSSTALHAARGTIEDRNGVVLAYTADAKDIIADPSQVPAGQRLQYAMTLAPLTGQPVNKLIAAISDVGTAAAPNHYAMLATAVQPGPAGQIDKLDLLGIYSQATTQRLYPGGTTAANVVGVVQADGNGAAGIEQQYDSLLRGTDGKYTYELDANGNVNPAGVSSKTPAINGGTVKLTISQDLQYWVQTELDAAVRESKAKSGDVVVMTRTGQVLAMASTTNYDPQDPSTIPSTPLNPAIQTVYEPGSVNKVVTFSAALEKGLITPRTVIKVPDFIDMGGVTVHDAWWHATQKFTATGIIAESSNVGTLKIAQKVGPTVFDNYLKAYGLGQQTGIELPAESPGLLPPMSKWSGSTFANLPIGQGVAMTALQMTSMYQTIANNGVRIPPRIVESVTKPDGTVVPTQTPAGIRVTSAKTATTLRTMLESVMETGGTGVKAAVTGYRIAGKTGTAQQPDPKTHQYSATANWDTFAGMAPADNAQFVVGIMIDNPAHGLEGGDVAAPLFHEIATYELQHDKIAPTGSKSVLVPLQIP